MRLKYKNILYAGWLQMPFLFFILLIFPNAGCLAQKPPRPITVIQISDLSFGAFYQGTGGTVSVDNAGVRTRTGDIVLLGLGYTVTSAVFRITGRPGTMVNITFGPDSHLDGSNGGYLELHIDPNISPPSPLILMGSDPVTLDLHVGGTITVGSSLTDKRGSYTGTYTIIFNQN
jgi:hypothetical protein